MIIAADWLVTGGQRLPFRRGAVRVVNGLIEEVGSARDLIERFPDDDVEDVGACAVLPGFVNSHVHLYGTLAHGIVLASPPTGFGSFLDDYWWPLVEDRLDQRMIAAASEWVSAEMALSGTTTFFDICEAPHALSGVLDVEAEASKPIGLRSIFSFEATERAGVEIAQMSLEENARFIDEHHNDPLVSGMMSWHTVFTCSPQFISQAWGLAQERGVMSHAHCNEGVTEGQWSQKTYGMGTIEFYESLGVASSHFLASQCVQLTERDIAGISQHDIHVSHMPLSNCEVGGGIAPIPELLARGATVGLGSDGYVNDMFHVMRGAFWMNKARLLDPSVLPAHDVLAMASEGGAKALGLTNVGRLEPGFVADLQVVELDLPTPIESETLADQLVLWRDGRHVRHVMVNGEWRVRDHQIPGVDVERARIRVIEEARRLWAN